MQRNKQGALTVESLSNNDEIVGIEHLAGSYNRIERPEPGVIKHDVSGIDTCGNQIFTHRHGFVVALLRVVAAQQQIVYLSTVIGVQCALNAVAVILVDDAGAIVFRRAQDHTDLAIG